MEAPGASSSHWQVYVDVPPLKEVVVERVELDPELMEVGLAEITGATRAVLTVTVAALEVTTSLGLPLSVTRSSKCQVPVVVVPDVENV